MPVTSFRAPEPSGPGSSTSHAPVAQLRQLVTEALLQRYAAPVVRVRSERVEVLDGKPLQLAVDAARAAGITNAADLIVPIDVAALPWWVVPEEGLQLWRQHGRQHDDGELVTEVIGGDPAFQVIGELDGWQLVRLVDGATGWVSAQVDAAGDPAFEPGTAPTLHDVTEVDVDRFAAVAESFLGTPYRWGGTTDAGIDCSGLAQRAAWQAGGCWLPRHSTALMRAGARVGAARATRGDVLVLRNKPHTMPDPDSPDAAPANQGGPRHAMHVAIMLDEATTVHASRRAWKVVCEPVDQVRERYDVLSVRRLGPA